MDLNKLIEVFILEYGLISIFVIVALEYAGAPLPSEIVLPLIGILTFKYDFNFIIIYLISILGGLFGSLINYYLGFKFGEPIICFINKKFPFTNKAIEASYKWIKKNDKFSICLARLIPLARTFISITSGVTKINLIQFIKYSTIGISIWNLSLISLGYFMSYNVDLITIILKQYSLILIILISIILIRFLYNKMIKSKYL